jgi:hypothetical protein
MSNCPSCNDSNTWPAPLPIAPSLSSCNPSRLSDIRQTHNTVEDWPNLTNINTPISFVDHEYTHGLADMEYPLPKSWNWIEKAGFPRPDSNDMNYNQIENGSRNQECCGDCWAFSITTVLGDRFAISHGIANPMLSTGWLTSCISTATEAEFNTAKQKPNATCLCGGNISQAGIYCEIHGVSTEECWPFQKIVKTTKGKNCCNSNVHSCPSGNKCHDGCANNHIFHAGKKTTKLLVKYNKPGNLEGQQFDIDIEGTTKAIQREIYQHGPVSSGFEVPITFKDFWKNKSIDDVYTPDTKETEGGHAISLVGWGGDIGNRYWLVRNSWGLTHDKHGYCKFAFSSDTNPKYLTGIDIPLNIGGIDNNTGIQTAQGGVVVFDAGDIPSTYTTTKGINSDSGGSPSPGPPSPGPPGSKTNTILYIILGSIIGVLFIGLIIFLYYKYKK